MNRDVGIRGILSPKKSPAEIKEDARADAEAMAAVIKKIGPISRPVSVMDPDDFGNINPLQAAPKPIKKKEEGKLQKYRKTVGWITRPKPNKEAIQKFFNEEDATDNELYAKLKNDPLRYTQIMSGRYDGNPMPKDYPKKDKDPLLEAAELKKAEMLVSKANAKTVTQLTNLKNWSNNSKKV